MLSLKKDLIAANEEHVMKMIYYMASRIAMYEIKGNEEAVLGVIKKSIEMSQSEEIVIVQVSEQQLNFLEELQKETKREFEFLKRVKFEGSPAVSEGGCVIRTNYGTIDAQLEERIHKLWTSIVDTLPKAKHIASVAS
jgi:flagellar assembly protein FliH